MTTTQILRTLRRSESDLQHAAERLQQLAASDRPPVKLQRTIDEALDNMLRAIDEDRTEGKQIASEYFAGKKVEPSEMRGFFGVA